MCRRLTALAVAATFLSSSTKVVQSQLHFASIGNWGTGSSVQERVAQTLKNSAKSSQISFVVSPGSNFVNGGVENLEDPIWTLQFDQPYRGSELHVPFFTVLGHADWKGNFTALADRSQADYATAVQAALPKWTLPNWWYHYSQHFHDATHAGAATGGADVSIGLIFIDTFILSQEFAYQNISAIHWNTLRDTLKSSGAIFDWTVVVGDVALVSSGASKGNARLRKSLGALIKDNSVDVYISGNDYNMEIIEDDGLTHINCGTGSGADRAFRTKVKGSVAYYAQPGFCHHIVTKESFRTQFVNGNDGNRRPTEGDWFIQGFGTIGLIVVAYLVFVLIGTTVTRIQKVI